MIALALAQLCVVCEHVVEARGEVCPKCMASGSLLSVSRILNPNPERGELRFVMAPRKRSRFFGETVSLDRI